MRRDFRATECDTTASVVSLALYLGLPRYEYRADLDLPIHVSCSVATITSARNKLGLDTCIMETMTRVRYHGKKESWGHTL